MSSIRARGVAAGGTRSGSSGAAFALAASLQVEHEADHPVYEKLARETGGQVIALNPCDKSGAGSVALAATLGDPVLSIDERLSGEKAYTFDVAPELRRVSVSATTVRRIRLERADGSMVAGGTEGVQHAKTLNGEAWIVDDPPPGTWTVRVRAAGEFTLRVNAQRSAASTSITEPDEEGPPR
jgi:hypothetical protein